MPIVLTQAGLLAICDVCDKPPDPCTCDLSCNLPEHDPDEPEESCGDDCQMDKAEKRCRHRGELYVFRREFHTHLGCQPGGWVPDHVDGL